MGWVAFWRWCWLDGVVDVLLFADRKFVCMAVRRREGWNYAGDRVLRVNGRSEFRAGEWAACTRTRAPTYTPFVDSMLSLGTCCLGHRRCCHLPVDADVRGAPQSRRDKDDSRRTFTWRHVRSVPLSRCVVYIVCAPPATQLCHVVWHCFVDVADIQLLGRQSQ